MPVTLGEKPQAGFDDPFGLLFDCHRRIEMFLGVLTRAAGLLPERALTPEERSAVERSLNYFRDAAPRHTADEERSLFPRLRACSSPEAGEALRILEELEADHRQADQLHAAIDLIGRQAVAGGSLPPEDVAAFADAAARLRSIYSAHIQVEDRQIFPVAQQLLSEPEKVALGQEMAQRRSIVGCNPKQPAGNRPAG